MDSIFHKRECGQTNLEVEFRLWLLVAKNYRIGIELIMLID